MDVNSDRILSPQQNSGLYPAHFEKGALVQLATNEIKRVEDLTIEDFHKSTECSPDLKLDVSTVAKIEFNADRGLGLVCFVVGEQRLQITVEAPVEHPFLVYDKGWCSVNPQMSLQRYKLSCRPLIVGDVCASLTLKSSSVENIPSVDATSAT